MATGGSIKSRYRGRLTAFVALVALSVFVVFSGGDVLRAIVDGKWTELVDIKHLLSLGLPVATLILDGIVTSDFKAALVYWKWRNPLPGHAAFTVHGRADSRVDMNALEAEHGPLPTDPVEQNRLWYKLSKATANRGSVDEAHYAWLLARDLTSLSFALLIVTAGLAAVLRVGGWEWNALITAQGLLYVVLSQVAANKGIRFVTTVLAEAGLQRNRNRRRSTHPR
ncbi:MAG: hypothetical protein F4020_11365 [Gammaproteobacteria bacterium]|nr:hypothetical protein [Gammaproteobacteria bacterium]